MIISRQYVTDEQLRIAKAHIEKAERSQGPMDDSQRRELLEDKTDWSTDDIWATVDALTDPDD